MDNEVLTLSADPRPAHLTVGNHRAHLAAGIDKPYVVSFHSDIVRQKHLLRLYRPLMRRFLDRAGRIIAAPPNYLESSAVLQHYRDKVEVIPYGLDKAAFPVPRAQRLQYWAERCGSRFLLFVGVMRHYKGCMCSSRRPEVPTTPL